MRTYIAKSKREDTLRKKLTDQRNDNSLTHLLKNKELTVAQKRALVSERNPFIHALGIGRKNARNKTISQAEQA